MGAAEGLLFSVALPAEVGVFVRTHVLCQVTGLTEVLPTSWVFAWEGAFSRVNSDVLDEIGGLGKGLATAFVLALIPAGKLATLGAGADNIHGSRSEGEDVDGSLRWTRFKRPRGRSLWRHLLFFL